MLFNGTSGYSKEDDLTYTFKPLDFTVGDRFRADMLEFAETGRIATWTPIGKDEYVVCDIGEETDCSEALRIGECALFEAYGVSYGNWIVN